MVRFPNRTYQGYSRIFKFYYNAKLLAHSMLLYNTHSRMHFEKIFRENKKEHAID